jgi:hypothetical protein
MQALIEEENRVRGNNESRRVLVGAEQSCNILTSRMSRPLPVSLSPHVCILESPDLSEVLEDASLPPLPNILQSFSPLPQGEL